MPTAIVTNLRCGCNRRMIITREGETVCVHCDNKATLEDVQEVTMTDMKNDFAEAVENLILKGDVERALSGLVEIIYKVMLSVSAPTRNPDKAFDDLVRLFFEQVHALKHSMPVPDVELDISTLKRRTRQ